MEEPKETKKEKRKKRKTIGVAPSVDEILDIGKFAENTDKDLPMLIQKPIMGSPERYRRMNVRNA